MNSALPSLALPNTVCASGFFEPACCRSFVVSGVGQRRLQPSFHLLVGIDDAQDGLDARAIAAMGAAAGRLQGCRNPDCGGQLRDVAGSLTRRHAARWRWKASCRPLRFPFGCMSAPWNRRMPFANEGMGRLVRPHLGEVTSTVMFIGTQRAWAQEFGHVFSSSLCGQLCMRPWMSKCVGGHGSGSDLP